MHFVIDARFCKRWEGTETLSDFLEFRMFPYGKRYERYVEQTFSYYPSVCDEGIW